MPRRYRVYLWVGAVIALSWLSLAFIELENSIGIGYFLGSMSAQVTLAAAWAAFGPLALAWRLPLSIGWVFSLWVVAGANIWRLGGPDDALLVVGIFLLVQWVLLQFPLWGLVLGLGLQLRYRDDSQPQANPAQVRFGIRHLLIITFVAGLMLGIGRAMLPEVTLAEDRVMSTFVFLAVAGVVMTFPLLVATLLRRQVLLGVLLSLAFVGIATVAEIPIFGELGGEGPEIEDFIAINIATAIVVLVVAAIVRLNGYSLQRKPKPAEA